MIPGQRSRFGPDELNVLLLCAHGGLTVARWSEVSLYPPLRLALPGLSVVELAPAEQLLLALPAVISMVLAQLLPAPRARVVAAVASLVALAFLLLLDVRALRLPSAVAT